MKRYSRLVHKLDTNTDVILSVSAPSPEEAAELLAQAAEVQIRRNYHLRGTVFRV